ncbi:hypothetical protein [Rhodococcus spongiicola]|uniref:Uncharacterized protein n=1 Tax=Rhodococcus spongiicola TaxID=2487352 RepID=A0A3S3ZGV2_9NOCA|nr:hypothetical protein [Rhodococcus spongiicola]RVW00470.1 hypothetical protein EF834_17690 [Rhodococcus spongiicola]
MYKRRDTPPTYEEWRRTFEVALAHAEDGELIDYCCPTPISDEIEGTLIEVMDTDPGTDNRADAVTRAWDAFHAEHPKP